MKFLYQSFIIPIILLALSIAPLSGQMTFKAHLTGSAEVLPVATLASGEITATLNGNTLTVEGSFEGLTGAFDATVAGGSHIHTGYAGQNGGINFTLVPLLDADLQGGTYAALANTFTLSDEEVMALMNRQMYVNIHTTIFQGGELRGQLLPEADAYFRANLLGSQEVPSVMTNGRGALAMELNGDQLAVSGAFSNLEGDFDATVAGGAHLHMALPGSNGDIEIFLNASLGGDLTMGIFAAADNTFTLDQDQIDALHAGMLYANIHTTLHGGGELRGQVGPAEGTVFRAHLSGSNESPFVTSQASGVVHATLVGDSLFVNGSFDNLESEVATAINGGAHIHTALAGSNGGVAIPLAITLDGDNQGGVFTMENNRYQLTADQAIALMARGMYVNIHSLDQMPGEIRGQLLAESQIYMTANLSSIFTNPSATSRGTGAVKVEISGTRLTVSGSFDGLGSGVNVNIGGGAHLHMAATGFNGDVIFPLIPALDIDPDGGEFNAMENTFELNAEQMAEFRAREFYVNIHSFDVPAGEIRGQVLGEANFYMTAPLSGTSEEPAVNSNARGMVILEVRDNQAVAVGGFEGLGSPFDVNVAGGAHLHKALAGSNGGVDIFLNATLADDNLSGTFEAQDNILGLTQGQIDTLRSRMYYANLHTEANQAGELRGQVLPLATAYFTTTLDGLNEVQPVISGGSGALKLELLADSLTVTGSFAGLTGEFDASVAGGSHLHTSEAGGNGGIAVELNATVAGDNLSGIYTASENTFALTEEQISSLMSSGLYANIHTTEFGNGELRGQVLTEVNFFPMGAPEITLPLDGTALTIEGDIATEFLVTWNGSSDNSPVAYIWQLSASENFETVLFQQNVGTQLQFLTDFGTVDMLLEGAGVEVGSDVTLYHRALASDGSVYTTGEASTVLITRGVLTDIAELPEEVLDWSVYPNITSETAQMQVTADRSVQATVVLSDAFGRAIRQHRIQLGQSTTTREINVRDLPEGVYLITLMINDRPAGSRRIIVQR